jgi:hypothetical protein
MLGMPLAFLTTETARLGAGLKSGAYHLGLESRLPGEDLAGGLAHVGVVEVKPNATGEHPCVLLTEAGVGAGLHAVDAGLDALHKCGSAGAGVGVLSIIRRAWLMYRHLSSFGVPRGVTAL